MRLSFEITEALYRLVNVQAITSIVDILYNGNPPYTSQETSVSVNMLSNPNEYLQNGYCNVNVHTKLLSKGRHNIGLYRRVVTALNEILNDTYAYEIYFQIEADNGFFEDTERDNMGYYNLRINFQVLNDGVSLIDEGFALTDNNGNIISSEGDKIRVKHNY